MSTSEPDDAIERAVREYFERRVRGEGVDARAHAEAAAPTDAAMRERIVSAIESASGAGATRTLGADESKSATRPADESRPSEQGVRIDGRYIVERRLGEGGFGVVYLVRDEVHKGNLRALKTLHADVASDAEAAQRFRNEIITVKALAHRYVPRFHNDGRTANGDLYYVMDYVDGVRLDDVLRTEGPLRPDRIADLVRQILEVLDFAHQKGVFHRDLKPANILLVRAGTPEEEVRVLDFGIAKIDSRTAEFSEMESMHTLRGGAIGTPHYMAPEQVTGRGGIDGRTDIYALGVIIYQMCSGRVPFTGKTSMEVAAARLTQTPPPLDDDTPQWLRDLVMRLLERQKEKRPDSNALRAEFDHLARGQRDLQRMITWIGAGLLAIALGVAWLLWERGTAEPAEAPSSTDPRADGNGRVEFESRRPDGPQRGGAGAAIAFRAPADDLRTAKPDVEVVIDAPGRSRLQVGEQDVDVDSDGVARATVRVATNHRTTIRVRDEAGVELGARHVFVDTQAPQLELQPPAGARIDGQRWIVGEASIRMRGRVDDGSDGLLATSAVAVDGASARLGADGGFEVELGLREGLQDVVVRAQDAVGNLTTRPQAILVDLTPPRIAFSTPADPTPRQSVAFTGTIDDELACSARVEFVDDETEYELVLDEAGRFSRTVELSLGANEWTVVARDVLGHESRRTFRIERTTEPVVVRAVEPASGRSLPARSETVRVIVTSNHAPSRVEVARGGAPIAAAVQPRDDGFDAELPLAFGANVFRVVLFDARGVASEPLELTYLREMPAVPAGCTIPDGVELDASGRPVRVVHDRTGLEFVLVGGGVLGGRTVGPFYLARREFTVADMRRARADFFADAESRPAFWDQIAVDRDRHPVVRVTFAVARDLCSDQGLRLPSPEEWDVAAGAAEGRVFPYGNAPLSGACNADDGSDGFPYTAPVGTFARDEGPCGALDLAGNVSEWCVTSAGGKVELRGGNWFSVPEDCRIDKRRNPPTGPSDTIGFRPALDAPPAPR